MIQSVIKGIFQWLNDNNKIDGFLTPKFLNKSDAGRLFIANRLAALSTPSKKQNQLLESFRLKRKGTEQSNLLFRLKKSKRTSKKMLKRTHRRAINIQTLKQIDCKATEKDLA